MGREIKKAASNFINRIENAGLVRPVKITHPKGSRLKVMFPDRLALTMWTSDVYEPEVTSFIEEHLKEDDSVAIVGAHVGYHAVHIISKLKRNGRVVCFEPTPGNFDLLKDNCNSANPKCKVILENKAVSDNVSDHVVMRSFGIQHSQWNTIDIPRFREDELDAQQQSSEEIIVTTTTLDKHYEDTFLDFLVIDAENAELKILEGARKIIERDKPIIIIEVGDFGTNDSKDRLKFLKEYGYTFREYQNGSIHEHQIQLKYPEWNNILCLPPTDPVATNW